METSVLQTHCVTNTQKQEQDISGSNTSPLSREEVCCEKQITVETNEVVKDGDVYISKAKDWFL